MATLLEKLKSKQVQVAQVTPEIGQTQAAAKLLQAKEGKVSTSVTPISAELEKAAVQDVKAQATPLQQAAALQSVQTGQAQEAIQAGKAQQAAQISQAGREIESKKLQSIADITQKVNQAASELKVNKEAAQAEARLFSKRLSTESYIQKLQAEAELNRLSEQVKFNEYAARQTFGNEISDMLISNEYNDILLDSSRSWDERMAELDINTFLSIADFTNKQEASRQVATSLGNVAVKGTEGYIEYQQNKPTTSNASAPSGGGVTTSSPNRTIQK